jgi:hypothetical protein
MSAIVASWPARVSCSVHASASSGPAATAAHGRAPCIAQPSASAQPGGTSSSAAQVSTSALEGSRSMAAMTTAIDSGSTSAHAPPRKRCRARGTPAAGSATHAACATVRAMVSAWNHTVVQDCRPGRGVPRDGDRDSHPDLDPSPSQGRCRRQGRRP